jgi:hypothetical protein
MIAVRSADPGFGNLARDDYKAQFERQLPTGLWQSPIRVSDDSAECEYGILRLIQGKRHEAIQLAAMVTYRINE